MPELADIELFIRAVNAGSLSAAGRELGLSPAVCSKRLARLEAELGARLLQRTSRRLALTEEGAVYFERGQLILAELADAAAAVGGGRDAPRGVLRVSAPVALGRRWIGPALARFAAGHPGVAVQLSLSDALVDLLDGGFDCAVRIGGSDDSRLVARHLADNRRVVCAAPAYLARRGRPASPLELGAHDCIVCIVMSRAATLHADWRFRPAHDRTAAPTTVRVRGRLAADNSEQANDWALAGLGLVRRSFWDVAAELADGRLVEVLGDWTSEAAPIQVLFPSRRFLPARTRLFIDLLVATFASAGARLA
ncbi:LysR family transcriptional regulator [Plasticicumulans lactativorans]|uniref:LysR family transcriptional regulator n=1 Tax=Plasticicumulans lactativorans TaxID=1133106 RepID=A0A4R2L4X1_9GAMM|nr:LysR family transcriptional regulator [Plasticicumulans lactativorans]TCO81693.1 LysR family transcriptional regulator [Plasticicumulans lactativorans]